MEIYRTYVLAAAKDKIARYKITDPFLMMFIHHYESSIDWNKVKQTADILTQIESSLLPALKSKIDPNSDTNNYFKEEYLDLEKEYRLNINNPDLQIQQALQMYRNDREGARKILVNKFNESKKESFDRWWKYVTESSEICKANLAFSYILLRKMFDVSPMLILMRLRLLKVDLLKGKKQ